MQFTAVANNEWHHYNSTYTGFLWRLVFLVPSLKDPHYRLQLPAAAVHPAVPANRGRYEGCSTTDSSPRPLPGLPNSLESIGFQTFRLLHEQQSGKSRTSATKWPRPGISCILQLATCNLCDFSCSSMSRYDRLLLSGVETAATLAISRAPEVSSG